MSTISEPPPPYTESAISNNPTHRARNGIPPQSRRSMEDEARSLPDGWVRQYDQELNHQFFVDTTQTPPRSIWHHPYDDDQYMSTLTPIERRQIAGIHRIPSDADIEAESTDEDSPAPARNPHRSPETPEQQPSGIHKLGRKMKDKLTSSTHPEREARRRQRERDEADAYRRHQVIRSAMARAARTGEPQLIGRDRDGKDVYLEPPWPVWHESVWRDESGVWKAERAVQETLCGGVWWGYGDAVGDGVGWGADVGRVDDLGWVMTLVVDGIGWKIDFNYDDDDDYGRCDSCEWAMGFVLLLDGIKDQ
ncbi:hypothetical protein DSL72_006575 [Monilinia vaccinii-corymbosi]|uniref:WW domain-containing protein n=1 Tax=Monilinia vaccinii-corymbosi TaxID=61207 RepID=A0A8A3PP49_9HELO|nr:hypothetical protein DSL72_006575 [Monilinia vaccinii-corymbosi]